jgi:hypothetical protein
MNLIPHKLSMDLIQHTPLYSTSILAQSNKALGRFWQLESFVSAENRLERFQISNFRNVSW